MRRAALAAVVLIAGGLLAAGTLRRAGTNAGPPNNAPLAVTGVTVVKGNGEAPVAGQTILIENGRFVQIFPDGQSPIPAHYEIVPASGRFAVPGLIDAHVHLATDPSGRDRNAYERLQGALRGGVTSVRDMAGDASVLRKLADSTHPTAPIPRIYYSAVIAGPTFFQDPRTKSSAGSYTPGEAPWLKAVSEESAIRDAVEQAKSSGATGIKLYADLPASLIPALVRVAHSQDMKVWAHATVFPARPEYPRTP